MELRLYVKQWTDYSANDGRSTKLITEEPVLQYRSKDWIDNGKEYVREVWKDVPTVYSDE